MYFDHNATSPLLPAARDAWLRASEELWYNPSSPYRAAARARNALEDARVRVAARFACPAARVVFTSGATEGNNAVLHHFRGRRAAASAIEHPSVLDAARALFGAGLLELQPGANGCLDADVVLSTLDDASARPALLSVMAANNETGALQPWRELAAGCRQRGIAFHCDAVQWVGRMPLDGLAACDFVTVSAHKFGGPRGAGILLVPEHVADFRVQTGGEQEHGRRGGTEALPNILAMAAALDAADDWVRGTAWKAASASRDAFVHEALRAIPGTRVATEFISASTSEPRDAAPPSMQNASHGLHCAGLWNTVMLLMPRHANTRWVARLDHLGFQASTGSACATGKEGPSHVLAAMGVTPETARRAVRFSAGPGTSPADWQALAGALASVWQELEAGQPGGVIEL